MNIFNLTILICYTLVELNIKQELVSLKLQVRKNWRNSMLLWTVLCKYVRIMRLISFSITSM